MTGDAGMNAGDVPPPGVAGEPRDNSGLRQAIGRWRDSLVNLTGTNRLLNFRPSKTGMLAIVQPSPGDVFARVTRGKSFAFRSLNDESGPGKPSPSPTWLNVDKEPAQLAAAIRSLYRRSEQAFLDRGLRVLYLAFGTLAWKDDDGAGYASPLLLVPVHFDEPGSRQTPTLSRTDDDPVVNPVLSLRLSQFGIRLPAADIDDDGSLGSFLDSIREAIPGGSRWKVEESLVLSCFSFNKEAMYRDLLENEDLISRHPAVAPSRVVHAVMGMEPHFTSTRYQIA